VTGPKEILNAQSLMQLFGEFNQAHEMFLKLTPCAEIYRKSGEKVLVHAYKCSASLIVNLVGFTELVPHVRDEMTRMMRDVLESFLRLTKCDPLILSVLETTEIYQQLLIISADKEVLEDRAEQERAVEASGVEAASFNLIETSLLREVEEKEIADIQALADIAQEQEKADEAAATTFSGQTKPDPRFSFGEQTKDIPSVKLALHRVSHSVDRPRKLLMKECMTLRKTRMWKRRRRQ